MVDPAAAKPTPPAHLPNLNRRAWLRKASWGTACLSLGSAAYSLIEAKLCRVLRVDLPIKHLPPSWIGTSIAFLSDTHHGPFVPLAYLERVVAMTNALKPDLVVLGGDYVHRDSSYITPGIEVLGKLEAPLGRFAVLGNHDHHHGATATSRALATAGITELTNSGQWLLRSGGRLWLGGIDDLWRGQPNLPAALGDSTTTDPVLLLSHNPDIVETIEDPRVSLVLSGHTHGGQIYFPGMGAPVVPSIHGQKYLSGYVLGPVAPVFVSRGVGTVTPPMRVCCPPEVVLISLLPAEDFP